MPEMEDGIMEKTKPAIECDGLPLARVICIMWYGKVGIKMVIVKVSPSAGPNVVV